MKEKISALIDQELSDSLRDEVIEEMSTDESVRQHWRRYHLMGNVIRHEVTQSGRDLSLDIMSKLNDEPTVLAPVSKTRVKSKTTDVWSAVGLFAVAASVTLLAVISLNPLDDGTRNSNQLASNQFVSEPSRDQQLIEDEFGEMLAGHGEFSPSSGLNGLIAYAKLVSNQSTDQ